MSPILCAVFMSLSEIISHSGILSIANAIILCIKSFIRALRINDLMGKVSEVSLCMTSFYKPMTITSVGISSGNCFLRTESGHVRPKL